MATKKKMKEGPKSKVKIAVKKKSKSAVGKKIVTGKQVVVSKKSVKAIVKAKHKKATAKRITKRPVLKTKAIPFLTHGPDLHLIPVTGEIHPARLEETHQFEKTYKHNEETALHIEQQKATQILAGTRTKNRRRWQ